MRSTERLPAIDVLRGVAALSVLFHHLLYGSSIIVPGWHATRLGEVPIFSFTILSNLFQGVALFFVLSGFVLYLPYASGKREILRWSDAKNFYVHRFWRLYPLFVVSLVFGALFVRGLPSDTTDIVMDAFWLLTGLFPLSHELRGPPYNKSLWTIGLEFWYSAALPPMVWLCKRIHIFYFAAIAIAASMIYKGIVFSMPGVQLPGEGFFVLGRFDDFVVGMVAAHCYVHSRPIRFALPLGIVSVLLGFMTRDAVRAIVIPPLYGLPSHLLVSVGFALVILGLLRVQRLPALPFARIMQGLGVMCYSIYAWQSNIIPIFHARRSVGHLLVFFVAFSIVVPVSYFLIEKGGMKLGKFLRRERTA